jgi:hypothetical protein
MRLLTPSPNVVCLVGVVGMSALDRLLLGKTAEPDPSGEPPKSEFLVQLFQKLVKGVKAANALPSSDDYKYVGPSFRFKRSMNLIVHRLVRC